MKEEFFETKIKYEKDECGVIYKLITFSDGQTKRVDLDDDENGEFTMVIGPGVNGL